MSSRIAIVLVLAGAVGCGVVSGILYAFSTGVMPGLGRLPPEQATAAMNSINVAVINPAFLGMFMGTAVLCLLLAVGSVAFSHHLPHARFVLVASIVYLVGTFGVTMIFNVPLNDQLAAVEPAQIGDLWPRYLRVWTNWNHLRMSAALAASVVFTLALLPA